jgi:hypothetical protein
MCKIITTDTNERQETYQFPDFESALSMIRGLHTQAVHYCLTSGESNFTFEHDGRLPKPTYPHHDATAYLPPKKA